MGRMWRQPDRIYGGRRSLETIASVLRTSASSIRKTRSIAVAWQMLTGRGRGQLGWSPVLASKTLHFLCRALGFEQSPPVAIDNAVILGRVWPAWRDMVPADSLPGDWKGGTWDAYLRYMTAISIWAKARGCTTTEMEAGVFAAYRAGANRQRASVPAARGKKRKPGYGRVG